MDNGQFASALVGCINVAGTVVAALLIEKCGRKQLLSLSFTGMGLTMLAMSAGEGPATLPSRTGMLSCRSAGCQAARIMLQDAWPRHHGSYPTQAWGWQLWLHTRAALPLLAPCCMWAASPWELALCLAFWFPRSLLPA